MTLKDFYAKLLLSKVSGSDIEVSFALMPSDQGKSFLVSVQIFYIFFSSILNIFFHIFRNVSKASFTT